MESTPVDVTQIMCYAVGWFSSNIGPTATMQSDHIPQFEFQVNMLPNLVHDIHDVGILVLFIRVFFGTLLDIPWGFVSVLEDLSQYCLERCADLFRRIETTIFSLPSYICGVPFFTQLYYTALTSSEISYNNGLWLTSPRLSNKMAACSGGFHSLSMISGNLEMLFMMYLASIQEKI